MAGALEEPGRLEQVRRLRASDRVGDPDLERVVRLATHITRAASGAVHILDADSQHRIAGVNVAGADVVDAHDSLCKAVVESGEAVAVVDATADGRFAYSSFVKGDHPVRAYAAAPLRSRHGEVLGTLCTFDHRRGDIAPGDRERLEDLAVLVVDVLEAKRFAHELLDASETDPLTGVANRRGLRTALEAAVAEGAPPSSLAFIDLDGFKRVNDVHGHAAGDDVLQAVGRRLEGALRADALVARYGGDEFVVLLPFAADHSDIGTRLGEALASPLREADGEQVRASVGITDISPGDDVASVLRRADVLMYRAKAARRDDTVVVAVATPDSP